MPVKRPCTLRFSLGSLLCGTGLSVCPGDNSSPQLCSGSGDLKGLVEAVFSSKVSLVLGIYIGILKSVP